MRAHEATLANRVTDRLRWWLPAICAALLPGCSSPPCANQVVSGLPSPDGSDIAFVYQRTCDRNAGPTTHVSVIDLRTSLHSGPGNVLIVGAEQPVKVVWLGPKRLSVSNFKAPVQLQNSRVDAVTIEFHQGAPGR
jgi:hypothetical protein